MLRYYHVLNRILDKEKPAHCSSAHTIIAWLMSAMRPLKWREIQCAISVDLGSNEFDLDQRLVLGPKEICGSLVDHRSDDSVQLSHSTVKM
jgi:hypothetical protein